MTVEVQNGSAALGFCSILGGCSVVVDLLFIVIPIVGFCNCSLFFVSYSFINSSFAIILMGKRELVALLSLCSWCLIIVVWLFLAVSWVCLQFVIMVFPYHTHLLFLAYSKVPSQQAWHIMRHHTRRHDLQ